VATPAQAFADGANLVVIGRPITSATDPGRAVDDLVAGLLPVA
jgi:orotidine-5'-phosphate decarboxylase